MSLVFVNFVFVFLVLFFVMLSRAREDVPDLKILFWCGVLLLWKSHCITG